MSEIDFTALQESILYISKNIKNEYPTKEIFLYMFSNLNHWKLAEWLDSTHVLNSNQFRNFFLGNMIENPQIHNFFAQIVYAYTKSNQFLIPKFIEKNSLLLNYQIGFKQNCMKLKLSSFFYEKKFLEIREILYFCYEYSSLKFLIDNNKSKKKKIKSYLMKPLILIGIEKDIKNIKKNKKKPSTRKTTTYFDLYTKSVSEIVINEPDYVISEGDSGTFITDLKFGPILEDFILNFSGKDYDDYLKWNNIAFNNDLDLSHQKKEFTQKFCFMIEKTQKRFLIYCIT